MYALEITLLDGSSTTQRFNDYQAFCDAYWSAASDPTVTTYVVL